MIQSHNISLSAGTLKDIFDQFEEKKVLVIGDIMLDAYWWGKVDRISPEAPVPIVSISNKEYRLGGAANVALNLKHLGAIPVLCAVAGNDNEAGILNELLEKEQITNKGIVISNNRPTTIKTRVIGNKSQMLRIDSEDDRLLDTIDYQNICERINGLIKSADLIIFEDYDKGVISEELIKLVTSQAIALNIPVAVDPKKRNFLAYNNVTLFKPNLRELSEGLKTDLNNKSPIEEIEKAAHQLITRMGVKQALITLSERGVYILDAQHGYLIPAHIRNIYDVSGAGDTVISVAALAMLAGADMATTAALANLAGGLVCEKAGVVPINLDELYQQAVKEFSK